jgi:two-component system response regulator AtoC
MDSGGFHFNMPTEAVQSISAQVDPGPVESRFLSSMSPAMQSLERVLADIAPTDVPVLLLGESGTGKDTFARHIHESSLRQGKPFVVNPPALPGAASGPAGTAARVAEWMSRFFGNGTVYVDEVADLDAEAQALLMEILSRRQPQASARLICSSHIDLEQEVRHGRFREDLYYRMSGVCLRLAPLRHRKEDIAPMVEFFLARHGAASGRPPLRLRPETLAVLTAYPWPGNVREMEYVLRSASAAGDPEAVLSALGMKKRRPAPAAVLGTSLKQAARAASLRAERELILQVLLRTHWNRKQAARQLQISYKALLYKLKQTGLDQRELAPAPGGNNA